jgi:hypothetical protein
LGVEVLKGWNEAESEKNEHGFSHKKKKKEKKALLQLKLQ